MLIGNFNTIVLVKGMEGKMRYEENKSVSLVHYLSHYLSNFFDSCSRFIAIRIANINSSDFLVRHNVSNPVAVFWCSNEKDIILDPYIGSGTTTVACEQLNRYYIGIDSNLEFCKLSENRRTKNSGILKLDSFNQNHFSQNV